MDAITNALGRVDWTVIDELSHLPSGRHASAQEELRQEYYALRIIHRQIGAQLPPRAALTQALYNVRRRHPRFHPRYDSSYFFGESKMATTLSGDPHVEEIEAMALAGGHGRRRPEAPSPVESSEARRYTEALA
ncbi:MAG TPA: hypothetical protein VFB34_03710 [Chloroflexota bacterium]|nr:hypothetical protein [Chloroflexota bacterium]